MFTMDSMEHPKNPSLTGAEARLQQMKEVVRFKESSSLIVMGDMNVRVEEEQALMRVGNFKDAVYGGYSWDLNKNKYYPEHLGKKGRDAPTFAFDRAFFGGVVCVEAFLVGQGRHFLEGRVSVCPIIMV